MKAMFISGSILAITGLLLLLRSLLVRGTSERPEYHRVYLMSFEDGGDDRQRSDDEWPSLIGTEEAPACPTSSSIKFPDDKITIVLVSNLDRSRVSRIRRDRP